MFILFVAFALSSVITLYFRNNPLKHSKKFMWHRFVSWFPLGMTYAFLYMARYNLNVSKNAMGDLMSKESFGIIFGVGTTVYGLSFLLNGPLVDKLGGKKGIIIAALGSCLANAAMGILTYIILHDTVDVNLTVAFATLYSINMFFQSYGAVSIIKVKAYWFHVRERGTFGAIFGTLISLGVYFAFDWGQAIVDATRKVMPHDPTGFQSFLRTIFAVDVSPMDSTWLVFFIPSILLVVWALIDMVLIKDSPAHAGFDDFDPHDASSGDDEKEIKVGKLLKKIFTNPIMLMIALTDFTSGVIRNGIMQWYLVFAREVPQVGAEFISKHWGFLLCITGITGGFASGMISDKIFHSRRGPPAVIMNGVMLILITIMAFFLMSSPMIVGTAAVLVTFAVIGVHSLMSGTAAADFGGRKATATASGIVDGCVYLGSGIQSISLGYLTSKDWHYWPLFLIPFTILGMIFALKLWSELPEATKRYLEDVEKKKIPQRAIRHKK